MQSTTGKLMCVVTLALMSSPCWPKHLQAYYILVYLTSRTSTLSPAQSNRLLLTSLLSTLTPLPPLFDVKTVFNGIQLIRIRLPLQLGEMQAPTSRPNVSLPRSFSLCNITSNQATRGKRILFNIMLL